MIEDTSQHWPGSDEKAVVAEMHANLYSPHWEKCRWFVAGCMHTTEVPPEHHDDVIQEVMLSVWRGLPNYRGDGLRAWLRTIVRNEAVNWFRKQPRRERSLENETDLLGNNEVESEEEALALLEEEYLIREELRETLALVEEFASLHGNPERTIIILQRHYGGHNQNETAALLGISAARVNQIISAAKRFIRKRMGREPDDKPPAPRHKSST